MSTSSPGPNSVKQALNSDCFEPVEITTSEGVHRSAPLPATVRLFGDRLAERQDTVDRGVSGRAGVDGALGGCPDEGWCVEVRLAGAEVDDGTPGGAQRLGPLGHGDRR